MGYCRISTEEQDLDRQLYALGEAGCEKIYRDVMSGAKSSRPELDKMMAELQAGDVVVIQKLDRLGRSIIHLHTIVAELSKRGVALQSLTEGFDVTTSTGKAMFGMLSVFAEWERDTIRERTKQKLAVLKSKGVKLGREKTDAALKAETMINNGDGRDDVMRVTGISSAHYYRLKNKAISQ